MDNVDLPVAVHSGDLTICGETITVHILDDGQRVVEGDGLMRLLTAMLAPDAKPATPDELEALADLVRGTPRSPRV